MSLISIAKAYRTSPTNALQVISNILPLDLKVIKLYWKYQLLGQRANSIQTPIVHASMEELIKDIQNYGLDAQQKANIVHPAEPNPEITEAPAINDKTYNVFTDGSKSVEGVGCALVVNNTSGKSIYQAGFKLGMQCSNNQAESLAILKALQYIRDKPMFRNKTIRINSDSKTALAQIRKLRTKLTIVQETINLLMLLRGKGIKILLNWVKGHSGITGNERADLLAKKAAKADIPISLNTLPSSLVKSQLDNIMTQLWQQRWEADKNRQTCLQIFSKYPGQEAHVFLPSKLHYHPNRYRARELQGIPETFPEQREWEMPLCPS
ncbi:uncharacterized protein [Centruroides vittatus]|uniref:uncharacterized protein n=1 Tax=Centruroides vittatus TaxID=120091 RepID=UPI003510110B